MRLLLIRHGQTQPNVEDVIDTRIPGPPLTAVGAEQAAALPAALAGEDLGALWVSSMVRTHQSAAPLARAAGQETVALVAHGTAIRCWTARRADNLDAATLEQRSLENTGVVVLEATPQGARPWTCRRWMGAPVSGIGAHAPTGPAGGRAAAEERRGEVRT